MKLSVLALVLAVACTDGDGPLATASAATTLTLSPLAARLVPGDSVRLQAFARDVAGQDVVGVTISWTSRVPALASASTAGIVRARALPASVSEEPVWIVAAAGTLRDSARMIVAAEGSLGAPRMGANLDMVNDWSTEWPFIDLFRESRRWISQRNGAAWGQGGPLALTPDQWVASLEPGQYATSIMLTGDGGHQPGGEYVLLYDGAGDLRVDNNPGVTVLTTATGRITVRLAPATPIFISLRATDPTNPVRNIRFKLASDETGPATSIFTRDFVRVMRPFGAIRFMNWQATNYTPPGDWANRSTTSLATYAGPWGVPVETMVALANETGADAWFAMPHAATDDYVRQFAQLVRALLDPRRKVYVEYSNEVWNGIFPQATYAADQGAALNLSANRFQGALRYQSQRSVEMFRIWRSVFGADSTRVVRVLASQSANSWTAEQVLTWQDAYRETDVLAIAPYFGGRFAMNSTGAPEAAMTETQVLDSLARELETTTRSFIEANARIARTYGVRLVAYEGGQHLVSASVLPANEPAVTALFKAVNRNQRMGELYRRYFEIWYGAGGDLFMAFVPVGAWGRYGSWGALEHVYQPTSTSPKYQAIVEAGARFGR